MTTDKHIPTRVMSVPPSQVTRVPATEPATVDGELDAMARVWEALAPLDKHSQARVIRWAMDRLQPGVPF